LRLIDLIKIWKRYKAMFLAALRHSCYKKINDSANAQERTLLK